MGRLGGITNLDFLWWSLSLGACLRGNGTIIGASANLIVIGMAEKRGELISFMGFLKVGFPLMLMSILLSTAYLLFWYVFHTMTAMVVTLVIGLILALISKLVSARIMAPVRENA
jgi:hypothetical protein